MEAERILDAPGRLARELAELRGRLRPFAFRRGAGPAALGRLEVTAALLPELADHAAGFLRLGLELDRLVAVIAARPAVWPPDLDPFMADLADFLDDRLAVHDRGGDPAAGPGWERQRSFWCRAGDPREIVAILERDLGLWHDRWPGEQGTVAPEWRAFRERADHLFPEPAGEAAGDPLPAGAVVLAVTGALRREQVRERLEAMGLEAIVPPDKESTEALAAAMGARAILADDLEPERSLARLARRRPGKIDRALVLVSAGDCRPAVEDVRARRLGADGAWCEPWIADELIRILHRPSHP